MQVQRITDRAEIRRRLNTDRNWSLYALADLDPGMFELSEWWSAGDGLALVFSGIAIRPIFIMGKAEEARALLAALPVESGYLNLRKHHLEASEGIYTYADRQRMRRMVIHDFRPRMNAADTIQLGPEHAADIRKLYATGTGAGIAFDEFQLETGFFRGILRNDALVAVAGVHVVSRPEGVAGAGNVFTRLDSRGQGFAQAATSAVVEALLAAGIKTIGLNVETNNAPAIAAYERLGFRTEFEYSEGVASRVGRIR